VLPGEGHHRIEANINVIEMNVLFTIGQERRLGRKREELKP
jgi:hypothetical protein